MVSLPMPTFTSTAATPLLLATLAAVLAAVLVAGLAARLARPLLGYLRVRRLTAALPGPHRTGWPLVGALPELLCPPDELYERVEGLCRSYGPVFRLDVGPVPLVVVMEPADLEAVIAPPDVVDVPPLYQPTRQMLGAGLPFISGDIWRRRRHTMDTVMHLDVLKGFVPVFHRKALRMAARLGKLADDGALSFDPEPMCLELSNSIVCATVMSSDLGDDGDEVDEGDDPGRQRFLRAVPRALYHAIYRTCRPWLLSEWLYSFTGNWADYVQVKKDLDEFTFNLIRKKKENLIKRRQRNGVNGVLQDGPSPTTLFQQQSSSGVDGDGTGYNKRQHKAFLDYFLSSEATKDALSENELADEAKTLAFIGSGSTVDALVFIMFVLAARQDIQDKVVQELEDIFQDDRSRPMEASDLSRMRYLECVIREVLRYFSVAPIFGRTLPRDVRLPSSGFVLPQGCHLLFWLPYVNGDPRWYPEPRRFDPDRFLPEQSAARPPFSSLSFGGGARSCFGQRYAMMLMKTVTATLVLSRLRIVLPPGAAVSRLEDVRLKLTLTMSMRDSSALRVIRR